jgi:Sulfotransferase domain
MLSWPPGPRLSDGVWAPYWYASVEASTGFGPWRGDDVPDLPDHLAALAEECRPFYDELAAQALGR